MATESKPGEALTQQAELARKTNLVKNTYKNKDSEGYSASHPNAIADGDDFGKGANVEAGSKADIFGNGQANTGRVNNLKINTYNKSNEYSAGNLDSGPGFETSVK